MTDDVLALATPHCNTCLHRLTPDGLPGREFWQCVPCGMVWP